MSVSSGNHDTVLRVLINPACKQHLDCEHQHQNNNKECTNTLWALTLNYAGVYTSRRHTFWYLFHLHNHFTHESLTTEPGTGNLHYDSLDTDKGATTSMSHSVSSHSQGVSYIFPSGGELHPPSLGSIILGRNYPVATNTPLAIRDQSLRQFRNW